MSNSITLVSIVGARPQFVKLAPIARALVKHPNVRHRVIHTGQHYDQNMSANFFDELRLPVPDIDLGVGSGGHGAQTGAMLEKLEAAFLSDEPSAVLVYGDTNSTLAATLAAAKIHVPVAHIEAGLRSFNRSMPEEVNRLVADHCGDRLYAPTPQSMENLAREGLQDRAVLTGDVMLDAVLHNIELAKERSEILAKLNIEAGNFGLVTVHRPVNTEGSALTALMDTLASVAANSIPLVFPVHPRTRKVLDEIGFQPPEQLRILEPLPYLDNISMISAAAIVVTDSGGVQKEAAFLHTPCLTMRDETEWTETVKIGVNRLVGDGGGTLASNVAEVLRSKDLFSANVLHEMEAAYGKGNAAEIIVDDLVNWSSRDAAAA